MISGYPDISEARRILPHPISRAFEFDDVSTNAGLALGISRLSVPVLGCIVFVF